MTSAVTININSGGAGAALTNPTLTLDNANAAATTPIAFNVLDRLADNVPIVLNGGTLNYLGNNTPGVLSTETVGRITLASGNSTVQSTSGTGLFSGAILTSAGLTRLAGATVAFAPTGTIGLAQSLGTDFNQIRFTSAPALTNGILPYATVTTLGVATLDFATLGPSGVTAFTNYKTSIAAAGPTDNVRITTGETLAVNKTINSLIVVGNPADLF